MQTASASDVLARLGQAADDGLGVVLAVDPARALLDLCATAGVTS